MVLAKLDTHMQKYKVGPLPFTIYKNNLKWIKDLNVTYNTLKLLRKNITGKLNNIRFGNDFLHMAPKAQAIKVIIDKMKYIKI